ECTQMRLHVVLLDNGYYEFIWSHHHIIMDGWCLGILINDFTTFLGGLQQGLVIPLPEAEKYSSYIQWLSAVDKEASLSYWKAYLEGITSPTVLPFVNGRGEEHSDYLTESLIVKDDDFKNIEDFCHDSGITLNTYVQGVWSYLLSRYNRSSEVVFGSVVSGRPAEVRGIENMVGLFINTIPVCVTIEEEETPRSLLHQLHQDSIHSSRYHFNSLAELQSLSPLGNELINHILVFENYVKNDHENASTSLNAGLSSEGVDSFEQTNYAFTLVIVPGGGKLYIEFRYDSSVFSCASIRSLVSHFKTVLDQFAGHSEIPLRDLDYVSDEEKLVLSSFNDTAAEYPASDTIVSLFESQVDRSPSHTAVVFGDLSLSYWELNAR
ncbi:condensation domain-containing protein, partial [Chryseobacterium sp. ON_d1]|uniref:condensation domain-containing protein n=1 Tax=Chryseobacterium sp. ON_d1 TaxID=2583211 RepID=UPI001E46F457